ncbi:acetyl-CoA C-acetyltransferase [Candidatus Palauibacter sp.]|uniref:acetyl-CoA C-acetyltransferase n=1 Tax=Candidatus Palauibacter sp. TaxID=3101350 RepID=UPI003B0217FA
MSGTNGNGTVFLSAARTAMGAFGGSLKDHSAVDLGVVASSAAVERSGVEAAEFGHVVMGNVMQTSADAIYLARHVGLRAGLPIETPAVTVNRLCGSGFQAVIDGSQEIELGESDVCLVGGAESMSQAPHIVRGARWGLRLGPAPKLEDSLWEALTDPYCGYSMAQTAENLAEEYGISRSEADEVAVRSQRLAAEAWDAGRYADEVVPVTVGRKGRETSFDRDEHLRPDTTTEGLAKLRPHFKKDGLVTAGNASGIGDGAAALVLAGAEYAAAHGLEPLGRLVSYAVAGVPPHIMGIGPAPASRIALDKAGLSLEDMDLVEVNEAFAPQYLAVERELGLDRDKVNVDGGAIALSHPLGMTGARITGHLLHELRRRGGGFGLGAACIGGGQGAAVIVEVDA